MRKFNDAEIMYLRGLKAVNNVTANRIMYSKDFKRYFLHEYQNGKSPTEIFRKAGLPVVIIGRKRIERCTYRWVKERRDKDIAFVDDRESEPDDSTQGRQYVDRILLETGSIIKDLSSALSRVELIIGVLKDAELEKSASDVHEGGGSVEGNPSRGIGRNGSEGTRSDMARSPGKRATVNQRRPSDAHRPIANRVDGQ